MLSSLVREQIAQPSPIRQIMKMAERQNILAMGLDPTHVISFGGGWVNHPAPEALREAYREVVSDPELFHRRRSAMGSAAPRLRNSTAISSACVARARNTLRSGPAALN
jgi:hypothetical protein